MKNKILKILIILLVFCISYIVFVPINANCMLIRAEKASQESNTELFGGTIGFAVYFAGLNHTFFMVLIAIWVKLNKKLDKIIKNTIYFLPVFSIISYFILLKPVYCFLGLIVGNKI